ncbi:MAG TPA: DUF2267 domain-containing protein [Candidatus Yaniella excrementigallinarum]|nr:DUF2267 domain-containing protein [Candidatus Yaniella excrementigallinarum]
MTTQEIIEGVQDRTAVSEETANVLLEAVLSTLAELDFGRQKSEFASQLPDDLGDALRHDRAKNEDFDAAEFVRRVAERTEISFEQSETWTRATLSLLAESVAPGQRESFVEALPHDIPDYTIWDV